MLTCQRAQSSQSTAKLQILPALKGSCLPESLKCRGARFNTAKSAAGRRINNASSLQPQVPQPPVKLQKSTRHCSLSSLESNIYQPQLKGVEVQEICKSCQDHMSSFFFFSFNGSELMDDGVKKPDFFFLFFLILFFFLKC